MFTSRGCNSSNIRRAGYYAEVTSFASLCVYNNSSFYLRHNLLYLKTNVTLTISLATAKGSKNFTERAFFRNCFDYFTSNDIVFRLPWSSISVRRCFAGGSGEADLVVVCRFAGIRVVEMPVEDGIRTGVGSFEDKLLPFAGEAFRKIKDGVMLRIDQFDLPAPVFAASRFDRRQGSVVDMIVPVIIFFGRRQYEPRACDHPADRFARAVHPETAVRRKIGHAGGRGRLPSCRPSAACRACLPGHR